MLLPARLQPSAVWSHPRDSPRIRCLHLWNGFYCCHQGRDLVSLVQSPSPVPSTGPGLRRSKSGYWSNNDSQAERARRETPTDRATPNAGRRQELACTDARCVLSSGGHSPFSYLVLITAPRQRCRQHSRFLGPGKSSHLSGHSLWVAGLGFKPSSICSQSSDMVLPPTHHCGSSLTPTEPWRGPSPPWALILQGTKQRSRGNGLR